MGKPRRLFSRGFKVEAIKLISEQGRRFAEAAANLGIAELKKATAIIAKEAL